MSKAPPETRTFTLDELATLADLPRRTVRYYIQLGLVDRPDRRDAGRALPAGPPGAAAADPQVDGGGRVPRAHPASSCRASRRPCRSVRAGPGSVEVWSHLVVTDGVELTLEPSRAGLAPEEVREFFRGVLALYENIKNKEPR